jgi:hypothetical protein
MACGPLKNQERLMENTPDRAPLRNLPMGYASERLGAHDL